jgi:hypothetical protein
MQLLVVGFIPIAKSECGETLRLTAHRLKTRGNKEKIVAGDRPAYTPRTMYNFANITRRLLEFKPNALHIT